MEILDDEIQTPVPIVSTLEDLEYFIGDDKKTYYLESFQSPTLKTPKKVSLNPSAFFFGLLILPFYFFTKDANIGGKIAFLCLFLVGSLYSTQKFRYS